MTPLKTILVISLSLCALAAPIKEGAHKPHQDGIGFPGWKREVMLPGDEVDNSVWKREVKTRPQQDGIAFGAWKREVKQPTANGIQAGWW